MTYNIRPAVELKDIYTSDIIKTIIAFANTNGGKIYIGIEDNGTIIGIKNIDFILSQIKNTAKNTVKPDITPFTLYKTKEIDEKKVLLIEVQKGTSCPYYISSAGINPNGVYIREGTSTVPAEISAISEMAAKTSGGNYEDAVSINQKLTFNYMNKIFREKKIEINKEKMKNLGIINDDDVYTNLAFLLSDQCSHIIKLAVFCNNNDNSFENRYEFSASLLEQLDLVISLIDMQNKELSDNISYPCEAVKEALFNSVCHRDYSINAPALISIFSDRIEIFNSGGLAKGVSKNDIKAGTSVLRNKKLANILYRLGLIEVYGTGIIKIEKNYADCNNKPKIFVTDNTFKIILPKKEKSEKIQIETAEDISENEKKVLEFAKSVDLFTRQEISDKLNLTKSTAISVLKKLLDNGFIIKDGKGKNIFYYIKTQN